MHRGTGNGLGHVAGWCGNQHPLWKYSVAQGAQDHFTLTPGCSLPLFSLDGFVQLLRQLLEMMDSSSHRF